MRVLVTGGAGYVGSTLVSVLLTEGHFVRVVDALLHGGDSLLGMWAHPQFDFIRGDIRDRDVLRSAVREIDAVVHLAAIVGDPACARERQLAVEVNLCASLALLAESQKASVTRFVFASTCSNYGRMANPRELVAEDAELRPLSLYAETKVAFERALLDKELAGDLCTTPLRFATVYGVSSRMRFDLTVNEFTKDMLTKKHLLVFGEQFWRPYIHVRDVARAIVLVLSSPIEKVRRQVFNVGSTDQNYQKQQLIEHIRTHVPDAVVEYVRKEEDPRDYRVSFSKIKHELGFECTRSVEDGVAEVVKLVNGGLLKNLNNRCYRN